MRCHICHKRDAVIHVTEIVKGNIHETHLCQECGQKESSTLIQPEGSIFKFEVLKSGPMRKKTVRVTHVPTKMSVSCDENLPEETLREITLKVLKARLK